MPKSYPYFPFPIEEVASEDEFRIRSPYSNGHCAISDSAADFLERCDGSRPLGQIFDDIAQDYGQPSDAIAAATQPLMDDLTEAGLLWTKRNPMRWFAPPAPPSLFWEITAECNLRCLHCVVSADRKLDGELTTEQGLALIHEWARLGVGTVTFSGGEPLMRRDFFVLSRKAQSLGIQVSLATNGTLINHEVARQIAELGMEVQVSLDGSNEEVYQRFRGRRRAFHQAIAGIQAVLQTGLPVTIGTVFTRHNIDDLSNMLRLVEKLGATAFRVIPFIPFGRGSKHKELELPPPRFKELTRFLRAKRAQLPFQILPLEFELTLDSPPTGRPDPLRPVECGGAVHYCTVTPIGEVLPCHFFEGVVADNVKNHPFGHIWTHSRFLNYFRSLQIQDIDGACQRCRWLSACRTGCKAANFSQGELFASNRHCWVATTNE